MQSSIQLRTATDPISRPPSRRGLRLTPFVVTLAWLALSPLARAQCNDGCDTTHGNTYQGVFALGSNTTGTANTAFGDTALNFNTTGNYNTAVGFDALQVVTAGSNNTATGFGALFKNTGSFNTAFGSNALEFNTTGSDNTACGQAALFNNTTGSNNTANGLNALALNKTGSFNTATGRGALGTSTASNNTADGYQALNGNTTGANNTANGYQALFKNTTGGSNTAYGMNALTNNTTGASNIAIGVSAGSSLTTGSNNVDIAAIGAAGESNALRIGKHGVQTKTYIAGISGVTVPGGVAVIVDTNGHLGTIVSSARYKDNIKPMDKASEAILALRPVTFRYKKDLDPKGIPQFGLVAEDVAKIDPDLVARDDQGKPYTVRYEAVNTMLLNEFLKEHRMVEEQQRTISELKAAVAQQEQKLNMLSAGLDKVTNELNATKPVARIIANN
ncbi:MAG: tail fiber domain-containing protein [Chthoniobacterales bacterium]